MRRHNRATDGTILAAYEYVNVVAIRADGLQRDDSETYGVATNAGNAGPDATAPRANSAGGRLLAAGARVRSQEDASCGARRGCRERRRRDVLTALAAHPLMPVGM